MQLITHSKDVFTEPVNIPITHVVSTDDNLAAGFAKAIKKQYPKYAHEFFNQKVHKINSIEANQMDDTRIIYSLITKHHYTNKPTQTQLTNVLTKLKSRMLSDKQQVVAMPTICCGLDRKNFGQTKNQALKTVKKIIKDVFADTDLTVIIDKQ